MRVGPPPVVPLSVLCFSSSTHFPLRTEDGGAAGGVARVLTFGKSSSEDFVEEVTDHGPEGGDAGEDAEEGGVDSSSSSLHLIVRWIARLWQMAGSGGGFTPP